eukprot:CAMPEP_0181053498 /NCGR_PEP_ID=MMETSP1070-20121207/18146_1 /TAXON_ID=265543 /ORGANISM="Minutocellus polymorphus, Strain NH13" /LENGTH=71 /DNA_ID=CAMNT_0023132643 /DNA_START=709 /DNA_END=922 /DNA_ORIENTATION=+
MTEICYAYIFDRIVDIEVDPWKTGRTMWHLEGGFDSLLEQKHRTFGQHHLEKTSCTAEGNMGGKSGNKCLP